MKKERLWLIIGVIVLVVIVGLYFYLSRTGVISITGIKAPSVQLSSDRFELKMTVEQGGQGNSQFILTNNGTAKASFNIAKTSSEDTTQPDQSPDWLSFYPRNGELEADKSQKIKVTVAALDLKPNSYQAYLQISEQTLREYLTIPIHLTVVGAP
ncbi:unnamed protein product, partial [marine sediment metagenome]